MAIAILLNIHANTLWLFDALILRICNPKILIFLENQKNLIFLQYGLGFFMFHFFMNRGSFQENENHLNHESQF